MYWTGTPTEFMSRFKPSHCFPRVQTAKGYTNSHSGPLVFFFVILIVSPPPLFPSLSLSIESKNPPIQTATKQPMKTEFWRLNQFNPPTLFFQWNQRFDSTHNALCLMPCLIFYSCYRELSLQTCMSPNTKEKCNCYRQTYLM